MLKKPHLKIGLIGLIALQTLSVAPLANAGVWENIKSDAADAWEATKETSSELADDVVESTQVGIEKAKKLGEKQTYVDTWEGIKASAANPESPETDEAGIPQ